MNRPGAIDAGDRFTAPGAALMADVVAAVAGARRYLPVDVPTATATAAETALGEGIGPRAWHYGPPGQWAEVASGGSTITWRTLAPPPAARTVVGLFRNADGVAAAVAKLLAARPPALVMLDLCDRALARWLLGADPGPEAARVLVARAEGEPDPAGSASRAAWQAIELAGGRPVVAEQAYGRWAWGPVHPPLGASVARVEIAATPAEIGALFEAVMETAAILGAASARAHPGLGRLHAYLPEGERLAEALAWLRREAGGRGATVDVGQPYEHSLSGGGF